jgi:hypothetical protein
MAGAWLNLALTVGCLVLVWVTYSVPQRKLTFEREARAQYLAVVKFVQLLLDMMLTAFPTTMRQFVALFILTIQIVQIFYALYVVRRARDVFTRRIRPPLVIKALLDMTGERAAEVDPFTLDMLERLEGLVKVRTQMIFSVRSGRQFLVFGVAALLVASLFQYSWEFAKILSYGNRYFTRSQIETIMSEANLPMYWPSYAADPQGGGAMRARRPAHHRADDVVEDADEHERSEKGSSHGIRDRWAIRSPPNLPWIAVGAGRLALFTPRRAGGSLACRR